MMRLKSHCYPASWLRFRLAKVLQLTLLLLIPCSGSAQQNDELEFNQLLELLDQQSSLATHSRLNIDHVPGMVSVMHGQDMLNRGLKTLWDAMAFIPGVHRNLDASGERNVIVRGVGKDNESGKIKLLLNGIAINASSTSSTGTLFDTPTSQINRIEFIRGPGSAIHGEFALMGVLNVITHLGSPKAAVSVDSNDTWQVDVMGPLQSEKSTLSAHINLSMGQTNGENLTSGPDRSQPVTSGYAPGLINNKQDFVSALLSMKVADIDISVQYQQTNRGDHFGSNQFLPPPTKQTVISTSLLALHLGGTFDVTPNLSATWSVDRVANDSEKNGLFLGTATQYGGLATDPDIIADTRLDETRYEGNFNLSYVLETHRLFAGVSLADTNVGQSIQSINLDPVTLLPTAQLNLFPTPVSPGRKRQSVSVILQDEVTLTEQHSLTAGLRYDEYKNIDNRVSPRIAWVWRISPQHILKFQHAHAFRPPTLLELDGALFDTLKSETSRTSEFSHIMDLDHLVLRNTFHYSLLKNLISFQNTAPFGYANLDKAKLAGWEMEINKIISGRWELDATLDVLDARNASTNNELFGATPWSLALAVDYHLRPNTHFNLQFSSLSSSVRQATDTREDASTSNTLGITLTRSNFADIKGLTGRVGIKNLLGNDIRFLAPANSYEEDYLFADEPVIWLRFDFTPGTSSH